MTYCLAIKVKSGIVGISDTRITSGTENRMAKKSYVVNKPKQSYFIMTSGLRSVRDKAITYFDEIVKNDRETFTKMYEVVNCFAEQVRKTAKEDKQYLEEAGFAYNLHGLIAGQLEGDDEHKAYLLYPEGNWVEVMEGTPFIIIGNKGFGKPILDRVLTYESDLDYALKAGFLSFNSTKVSANDVDYPVDMMYYKKDSYKMIESRYEESEMQEVSKEWQNRLSESVNYLPEKWMEKATNAKSG